MDSSKLKREKHDKESQEYPLDQERRDFLKMGLTITGVLAGGTVLSLISNVGKAYSLDAYRRKYPYKPHYSMVMRQDGSPLDIIIIS